jgi:hypothetical protein
LNPKSIVRLGHEFNPLLVDAGEVEAVVLDVGECERIGETSLIEAPRCLDPDLERVLGAVAHGGVEADSPRLTLGDADPRFPPVRADRARVAMSTKTAGWTKRVCESCACAVLPRLMTTDAVAWVGSSSPKVPVSAGTHTVKLLTDWMHVSGNDACPDASGCETRTTAWTTLQRSGQEAKTVTPIDRPSGASQEAEWISTVGPCPGRA